MFRQGQDDGCVVQYMVVVVVVLKHKGYRVVVVVVVMACDLPRPSLFSTAAYDQMCEYRVVENPQLKSYTTSTELGT